jgi:integral membrane protein
MLRTKFAQFRFISFVEGISYLILVLFAMPLKYFFEQPQAVKIFGMIHGILFILFCIALFNAMKQYKWSFPFSLKLFIYSLFPFLFILIDKDIMKVKQKA